MQQLKKALNDFIQKSKTHRLLALVVMILVLGGGMLALKQVTQATKTSDASVSVKSDKKVATKTKKNNKKVSKKSVKKVKLIDWTKPSENKPYPEVKTAEDVTLNVDLKKQRVFVESGDKTLYTMYASSGMNDTTPKGHFTMESERGTNFYNPEEKMGANYYSSFHDHGTYLFHTVPTDVNGEYIKKEADLLGQRPSSHGCIRLSIPDAKWIFDKIPFGTKVYVH